MSVGAFPPGRDHSPSYSQHTPAAHGFRDPPSNSSYGRAATPFLFWSVGTAGLSRPHDYGIVGRDADAAVKCGAAVPGAETTSGYSYS